MRRGVTCSGCAIGASSTCRREQVGRVIWWVFCTFVCEFDADAGLYSRGGAISIIRRERKSTREAHILFGRSMVRRKRLVLTDYALFIVHG